MDKAQIYEKVREHYSAASQLPDATYARKVAAAFGYQEEDLADVPTNANLGLSCGNPLALAKLKEGETVIDLGSGAGFDVFLAAKKVGSNGKVIGVDMNKDMLQVANVNKAKQNMQNVEFIESLITNIALPDAVAHCIISNCVLNLVPEEEKHLVFREMFRVLKPGGRLAISDILTKTVLPEEIRGSVALYVGCIAGASQVKDYENYLRDAGFADILIVDTKADLNVYKSDENKDGKISQCCGDSCRGVGQAELSDLYSKHAGLDFNELAGSFKIYAVKM